MLNLVIYYFRLSRSVWNETKSVVMQSDCECPRFGADVSSTTDRSFCARTERRRLRQRHTHMHESNRKMWSPVSYVHAGLRSRTPRKVSF